MEVERATCVAPATCVALPGGVKQSGSELRILIYDFDAFAFALKCVNISTQGHLILHDRLN